MLTIELIPVAFEILKGLKEGKDNKKAANEIRGLTNLEENNETTINSSS